MTPALTYQNLPVFGTGAALVQPVAGTYNGGFLPGQLFPAEYENWLMNYITANSSFSQTGVTSMVAELNNILTAASIAPNAGINTQVLSALQALFLGIGAQAVDSAKLGGALPSVYALLASPVFTGTPQAPTPSSSDNSTKIATTAFVVSALSQISIDPGTVPPPYTLPNISVGQTSIVWVNISSAGTVIFPAVGTYDGFYTDNGRTSSVVKHAGAGGSTLITGAGGNAIIIYTRTA